jgi:hypothetical protein
MDRNDLYADRNDLFAGAFDLSFWDAPMIGLAEVSACHIYWLQCVKFAKQFPGALGFQVMAQQAQMHLVINQALYWGTK